MDVKHIIPALTNKSDTDNELWQALQLFDLYRLCLALGFWTIANVGISSDIFVIENPKLYNQISFSYFIFSVACLLICFFFRKHYFLQANFPIFIDIPSLIMIMHACNGITSGIGILLIVIVSAHSLLVPGRLSIFSAALATVGLIIEHTYNFFSNHASLDLFTQVGLLGTVVLISAFFTNMLASKIRKNQEILKNQTLELIVSQQLNSHIISAMHDGVLILDSYKKIRLINGAARNFLDFHHEKNINYLSDLPKTFQDCFESWKTENHNNVVLSITPSTPEVRLNFHGLGKGLPAGTLVFIYDAARETRHAQDLKLASLGHLTANIAHELRNPLGAVSHAAQLLEESTSLTKDDRNLLSIITLHSDRMNTIIQNVLSLSSRKEPNLTSVNLYSWLNQFISQLSNDPNTPAHITFECENKNIMVMIDSSQFSQILLNLCENGLRYSMRKTGVPTLTLKVQRASHPPTVLLDIIDQGEGIPQKIQKHIFEPFFTTESTGSGLGLYIAKELSLMNGLHLDYYPQYKAGCQFRLAIPLGE